MSYANYRIDPELMDRERLGQFLCMGNSTAMAFARDVLHVDPIETGMSSRQKRLRWRKSSIMEALDTLEKSMTKPKGKRLFSGSVDSLIEKYAHGDKD